MAKSIERLPAVLGRNGRKRSSHYEDVKKALWTPPVRCGARSVGWPSDETDIQLAARIAGLPDEDLRELVKLLVAARTNGGFEQEQFRRWITDRARACAPPCHRAARLTVGTSMGEADRPATSVAASIQERQATIRARSRSTRKGGA